MFSRKKDEEKGPAYRLERTGRYYGEGWQGFRNWCRCGGSEIIAFGVLILAGISLFGINSSERSRVKHQNLVAKVEQRANINCNGRLESEEIGRVYQTIGKSFYESLTDEEMNNYLEKTK